MKDDNKGITIVEIMVAFTVLAVIMLVFYNCIKFSGNMMAGAADVDRDNEAFQRYTAEYFGSNDYKLGTDDSVKYTFTVSGTGDTVSKNIYYKELYFKPDDDSYEVSDSASGDCRRLWVFSKGN